MIEDYDAASSEYSKHRRPVGVESILAHARFFAPGPLRDQVVADIGCGVGLYAAEFLEAGYGRVIAADRSSGMLAEARARLAAVRDASQDIDIIESDVVESLELPRAPNVAFISLVLHHVRLEHGPLAVEAVLREVHRQLVPGGILITVTCSPAQVRHGAWYCELIPDAVSRSLSRHGTLAEQEESARRAGFSKLTNYVPLGGALHGPEYLDLESALTPAWRKRDSIFSLATDADIAGMTDAIRAMLQSGDGERWLATREERRAEVGQTTVTVYRG